MQQNAIWHLFQAGSYCFWVSMRHKYGHRLRCHYTLRQTRQDPKIFSHGHQFGAPSVGALCSRTRRTLLRTALGLGLRSLITMSFNARPCSGTDALSAEEPPLVFLCGLRDMKLC